MKKIVAFTGAGISKASGIPTFEEMPGIRNYLTRDYFQAHPGEFYKNLWQFYLKIKEAEPNAAHLALAEHDIPVVTMNVDGLHRRAGTKELVEIHGNLEYVFCPGCGLRKTFEFIEKDINCPECGNVLQPNVILYGDIIKEFQTAIDILRGAEVLLVVGTSFYTSTASDFVNYARYRGMEVEIINENAEVRVGEFLRGNTIK